MRLIYHLLPLACLICIGIWTLFGRDMLLGPLGDWLEKRVNPWYLKPIFLCPPCLASVHGTWVWFFFGGDFTYWLPFLLALVGINKLVSHTLLQ